MNKVIITFMVAIAAPSSAIAQEITPYNNMQNSAGSSATINTTNDGTDMSKVVPNVFVPSVGNVPETCAISNSAGGALSGFGLAIGKTHVEKDCSRRMYARLIAQMGDADAAKAILCANKEVREAYRKVNKPCVD